MRENHRFIAKKIRLPFKIKQPVLALGPQTKNTLCFARGDFAYLSPMHADLSQRKDLFVFEQSAKYFLKKHPKIIAYDLHPDYQSSKYVHSLQLKAYLPRRQAGSLQLIQHHHAHIASCMAENGLKNQKVIGVAFDGTGFGADEQLWGGEFLICDYKNFKRAAHLKEIPLLGGERAIVEPWRLAASWLYAAYKDKFLGLGVDFVNKIDKNKWRVLKKMCLSHFNSPLASSIGRLFDAAGSLVLTKYEVKQEAELAQALERLAACYKRSAVSYPFKILKDKGGYIIDPAPLFKAIVKDLKTGAPKEKIAYRFHLAVAEMIKQGCLILRKQFGINKVILSGGVFQNNLLLGLSLDLLYKYHFKALAHKNLSSSDASVSLGEAVIAAGRS